MDVASCVPDKGQLEKFVLDREGDLWNRRFRDDARSAWEKRARPPMLSLGVALAALSGRMELLACDTAGQVWQRSYRPGDEDWTIWREVNG